MDPLEGDTDYDKLWDGSVGPQGYPNIFHSNGANQLPQTLTFDMGKVYNSLEQIEETGRNCCHNPSERVKFCNITSQTFTGSNVFVRTEPHSLSFKEHRPCGLNGEFRVIPVRTGILFTKTEGQTFKKRKGGVGSLTPTLKMSGFPLTNK